MRTLLPALLVSTLGYLAGCSEPIALTEPTRAGVHAADEAEFDRLWEASLRVLRRHNFPPARRDRRAGVIQTLPTTAQHFFEFWRKDTVGGYEHAEANLHTLRKFAIVKIARTDEPDEYTLDVEVQVERLSQPERQITSASGALRSFSEVVPTRAGVFPDPPNWTPLGRDAKMESLLLTNILRGYGQPVTLAEADSIEQVTTEQTTTEQTAIKPDGPNEASEKSDADPASEFTTDSP